MEMSRDNAGGGVGVGKTEIELKISSENSLKPVNRSLAHWSCSEKGRILKNV